VRLGSNLSAGVAIRPPHTPTRRKFNFTFLQMTNSLRTD